MSDAKEYWPCGEDNAEGSIQVSEDVAASIAAIAIGETEGVAAPAANIGVEIGEMLGARRSAARGVKISFDEENQGCTVVCSVILKYGSSVTEVARNLQQNVKNAIESMTGIQVIAVDVQVNGIQLPRK